MNQQTVVFAAGSHTESIQVRTGDLFPEASVNVVALTRRPDGDAGT